MGTQNLHDARWIGAEYDAGCVRIWVMGTEGVLMRANAQGEPDAALAGLIAALPAPARRLPVIRSGWPDAQLLPVPAAPVMAGDLLPGMSQAAPAGIMRTQTVQIAGLLAAAPQFDGIVLLVGSQTLWAHVSAAEVVSFRSFLTPELLAQLNPAPLPAPDDDLAEAVAQAMSRPSALAADLASLRAGVELGSVTPAAMLSRTAGLLIGVELAAARPYWLGQDVVLIGDGALADAYEAALTAQGLTPRRGNPEAVTLAGMGLAWAAMQASAGAGRLN